jgi:hypothetical protein
MYRAAKDDEQRELLEEYMTTPANQLAQLNNDRRQLEAQALAALVGGHIAAPAQQDEVS